MDTRTDNNVDKNTLVNKLVEKSVLASPPDLLFKIINSLDSELSSHQIGEIVGHDQTVSAQVLKLSNSSFFGFKGEIKTLDRAINILGTKTVRNIAVTTLLFSHTNKIRLFNIDILSFWLQTFLVADITREICQKVGLDGDEGYIGGLLHHIGKLILYAQRQSPTDLFKKPHTNKKVLDYEKETWHVDSTELSTILLKKWNIPDEIVSAISQHKNPDGNSPLSKVVYIADVIANIVTDDKYICELSYTRFKKLLSDIHFEEEKFYRFCVEIPSIVSRGKMIMKVLAKKQAALTHRRTMNMATVVCPHEYSLAKCLLELLGFKVTLIHPDQIEKMEESKPIGALDIEEKEEVAAEEKKGFIDRFKTIFGKKKKELVVEEEEEEPEEEAKPLSWNPLVVFDGTDQVEIKRLGLTIYQVDDERNSIASADNKIPLFFSNTHIKIS